MWRKRNGMGPLPVPEVRKVPAVADAVLSPLLKTLIESHRPAEQQAAWEAIERLGLARCRGWKGAGILARKQSGANDCRSWCIAWHAT